jgi:hypothetical protein
MIAFPIAAFVSGIVMIAFLGFRDKAKYLRERDERLSRMKSGHADDASPGAKATA